MNPSLRCANMFPASIESSVLAAGPDVTLVRPERDLQLFEKDSQTSADSKFKTLPLKEHAATHGRACDLLLTPS